MVRNVDAAVAQVRDAGEDADHRVHLAVIALRYAVEGDERIDDEHVDGAVEDGPGDVLDQRVVDLELVVAVGDLEPHLGATGDEQPALEFLLWDLVVLADGDDAPVELLEAVLA